MPRYHQKKKDERVPISSEVGPLLRRLARKTGASGYLFENPKIGSPENPRPAPPGGLEADEPPQNMKWLAQYLGHTDIRTTAIYLTSGRPGSGKNGRITSEVPQENHNRQIREKS